jgi:3-methyladenine DNA glycosylase AlkD
MEAGASAHFIASEPQMPTALSAEVLRELESLGAERTRRLNRRHGVDGNQYGVKLTDLRRLAKRIGTDHALAVELWCSGNHDARVLTTLIADPRLTPRGLLESWVADIGDHVESDLLAGFVATTPHALDAVATWTASTHDLEAATGWSTLAHLALSDEEIHDDLFVAYLAAIEMELGASQNRSRHSMNGALIAIGCRNECLREMSLAAAVRIGRVSVDPGQTGCTTPEAAPYILRTWAWRAARPNVRRPGQRDGA